MGMMMEIDPGKLEQLRRLASAVSQQARDAFDAFLHAIAPTIKRLNELSIEYHDFLKTDKERRKEKYGNNILDTQESR